MKDLDIKPLMKDDERYSALHINKFKLLPLMAKCSKYQIGTLVSQSFAERMNSAGKNIVTDNRGKLDPEIVNKLVVLRMNRKFMEYSRQERVKRRQRSM